MPIIDTKRWFQLAVPTPTEQNVSVQIGCHLEEVAEMLAALGKRIPAKIVDQWGHDFKDCVASHEILDRKELLDALVDQIVTLVGVAHMLKMDIVGALAEVNRSNFSKFVDGKPVFKDNGKIGKSANYVPPDLSAFV